MAHQAVTASVSPWLAALALTTLVLGSPGSAPDPEEEPAFVVENEDRISVGSTAMLEEPGKMRDAPCDPQIWRVKP